VPLQPPHALLFHFPMPVGKPMLGGHVTHHCRP
jgi:hypothetical protein